MAGSVGGDDEEIITDINVTPLVDIILVLLLITMVTANYLVSKSIPVELPRADHGEASQENRQLVISIQPDGQLYLAAEPITRAALRDEVRSYRAEAGDEARAVIAADGDVDYREVVRVIDLLRGERVSRFALNVDPRALEGEGDE